MSEILDYGIIENISYTKDDITELIDVRNNNYYSVGTYFLLLSACSVVASEMPKNSSVVLGNSIEIVDTNFQIEDYQKSLTTIEDYQISERDGLTNEKAECIEEILSFKSLQESWDGYGALPLQVKSAVNAITFLETYELKSNFIKPTDLFPNPSGTISLIWENSYEDRVSVEIGNQQISYYTKLNNSNPSFYNNIEITEFNVEDITRKINSLF